MYLKALAHLFPAYVCAALERFWCLLDRCYYGGCLVKCLLILPIICCKNTLFCKIFEIHMLWLLGSITLWLLLENNKLALNVNACSWSVPRVEFAEIRNVRVALFLSVFICFSGCKRLPALKRMGFMLTSSSGWAFWD